MYGYGFEDYAQASYKDVDNRPKEIDDYSYIRSLSNRDMAVYGIPGSLKTRIGFRGTSKTADVIPDLGIALNNFESTQRYKDDKASLKELIKKRGGVDNIKLTGHSLGGKVAAKLGEEFGIETNTYNKGSTPLQLQNDVLKGIACKLMPNTSYCTNSKLVTNHIVKTDPISVWNIFSTQKNKWYDATETNSHSLKNFID
tara:strand:- start:260 stop:856 length:597 start_codon:yes stop_codon:yes gene_type:complete